MVSEENRWLHVDISNADNFIKGTLWRCPTLTLIVALPSGGIEQY